MRCAVCGDATRLEVRTPRFQAWRCSSCGHHVADFAEGATGVGDYHLQYEQGAFLEALRATRQRQARAILGAIRRELPAASSLLDLGCGRGWFLDEARKDLERVAGADSSRLAVDLLAERGIPAVHLPPEPDAASLAAALPFRPDVLTMLDVIEHFASASMPAIVTGIVDALRPELRALVVKVPVASGVLYRVARFLAHCGIHGPIEQLYQVGTEPPHRSYFSRVSLERCLSSAGLRVTTLVGDPDFEPESLAQRARPMARIPRPLGSLGGRIAVAASARFGMQDSVIAVARVDRRSSVR